MKSKKICSFILICALVFGGIGFTQSQMNIAYAMPDQYTLEKILQVTDCCCECCCGPCNAISSAIITLAKDILHAGIRCLETLLLVNFN